MWANPFKCSENPVNSVLEKYEKYIREKIISENLYDDLMKLEGKNLFSRGSTCIENVLLMC